MGPGDDLGIAGGVEVSCLIRPFRPISVLAFEKLPDEKNHEIRYLDHWMPCRIYGIAEFYNPLQFPRARHVISSEMSESVDLLLVQLLLVQDNHCPGAPPERLPNVPLDVGDQIVEAQLIGHSAIDDSMPSDFRSSELGLINSNEMNGVFSLSNDIEERMCQRVSFVTAASHKRTLSVH